jgi:hypothetical protein
MRSWNDRFGEPASARRSPHPRALRLHIERIERTAGRHEQPVALGAAEADVGADLRQADAQDRLAVGRERHDAVELLAPCSPTAPQIAGDVAAHAVGRAAAAVHEHPAIGELAAAIRHVIDLDQAVRVAARLHDVEALLVGRETDAVRPHEVVAAS